MFVSLHQGAPSQDKEVQLFRKAHVAADRPPYLVATKQFFVNCTAVCKATYGWTLRAPLQKLQDQLEAAVRREGLANEVASPHLVKLVVGHCLDPGFMSAQAISVP